MNRPLMLKDGQTIDNVVVKMHRGSAISGTVVDAYGDPVDHASVGAMRLTPSGQPEMRSGTSTNDLGEFRVARLQPGTYILSVFPQRAAHDLVPTAGEPQPRNVRASPRHGPGRATTYTLSERGGREWPDRSRS